METERSKEVTPNELLDAAFQQASTNIFKPIVTVPDIAERIEAVCRSASNRACVRVLLACSLAKSYNPGVDIRKPYTEIGGSDVFGGRGYDERYITKFIIEHQLPCMQTSGFLTPAFRNRNITL